MLDSYAIWIVAGGLLGLIMYLMIYLILHGFRLLINTIVDIRRIKHINKQISVTEQKIIIETLPTVVKEIKRIIDDK